MFDCVQYLVLQDWISKINVRDVIGRDMVAWTSKNFSYFLTIMTVSVHLFWWVGGITGSASDQRSEGCVFEAY